MRSSLFCCNRHPIVILEEKTLRLAHRFAQQSSAESYICYLIATLSVDHGNCLLERVYDQNLLRFFCIVSLLLANLVHDICWMFTHCYRLWRSLHHHRSIRVGRIRRRQSNFRQSGHPLFSKLHEDDFVSAAYVLWFMFVLNVYPCKTMVVVTFRFLGQEEQCQAENELRGLWHFDQGL